MTQTRLNSPIGATAQHFISCALPNRPHALNCKWYLIDLNALVKTIANIFFLSLVTHAKLLHGFTRHGARIRVLLCVSWNSHTCEKGVHFPGL